MPTLISTANHESTADRALDPDVEQRLIDGSQLATRYFMGEANVHAALERLVERLDRLDIPYAIVGALSMAAYGYLRMTADVDILLQPEGLKSFKDEYLGRGYVERFPGSKGMRDATQGVDIDVLLAGEYPGDGKVKPISFPDPAQVAVRGGRFALLPLPRLLELKLASGMTAPHRLRDLADVIDLIRVNGLDADFAESLDSFVRVKYLELVAAATSSDP